MGTEVTLSEGERRPAELRSCVPCVTSAQDFLAKEESCD